MVPGGTNVTDKGVKGCECAGKSFSLRKRAVQSYRRTAQPGEAAIGSSGPVSPLFPVDLLEHRGAVSNTEAWQMTSEAFPKPYERPSAVGVIRLSRSGTLDSARDRDPPVSPQRSA